MILGDFEILHEEIHMIWVVSWVYWQDVSELDFVREIKDLDIQSEDPSLFVGTDLLPVFYPQLKLILLFLEFTSHPFNLTLTLRIVIICYFLLFFLWLCCLRLFFLN